MNTMRCPKCDAKLMAEDEPSLSKELRDHLVATHKMQLPRSSIGKGPVGYGAAETISGPKVEGAWGEEIHGKKHLEERQRAGKLGPQGRIEVRCPVCGALMIGADEEEISGLAKTHMVSHETTA